MKNSQENIQKELDMLVQILAGFRNSVSINNIDEAGQGLNIERRTLQRRLKALIEQGKVNMSGKGSNVKYTLSSSEVKTEQHPQKKELIPLSKEGEEIQKQVSRLQVYRNPVGYNRDFLESYQPDISGYLTTAETQKLENLGTTSRMNEPAGTYAKEILQRLLIDLSWNSSRLEGNTYSLLDTQRLIKDGVSAKNKSAMEAQMILNHKDAIEFIVKDTEHIGFNRYTLLNLHALLSNNLLPNAGASGRLRTFGVGITGSVFTPLGMPQLIEEMFELMLYKAEQIKNPFEQAFFIMVQLPYLQPFDDVNKRVSRLAANIPLNRFNLAPLSFIEVQNEIYVQGLIGIYELNRVELLKDVFMWAYDRSAKQYGAQRQSLGEPDPFRLKYREPIRNMITQVVTDAMPKSLAIPLIKVKALQLPHEIQGKFIEAVETELFNLHEGNFARYMIKPSEFENWQEAWNG